LKVENNRRNVTRQRVSSRDMIIAYSLILTGIDRYPTVK